MALFSLGGLMGSYARPELFIVYILLSLVYLGSFGMLVLKKKRPTRKSWLLLITWIFISVSCLILVGIPAGGTERLNQAFAQHFSLNWVEWNNLSLDGWTDYPTIMQQAFGSALDPWHALLSNPDLFVRHVLTNTKLVVPTFWNIFIDHTPIIGLPWHRTKEFVILSIVAIAFLIYSLIPSKLISNGRNGQLRKQFRINVIKHFGETWETNAVQAAAPLVACIGYLLAAPLSILIIWPRGHYIFLYGIIFILMLALLAIPRVNSISLKQSIICGLVLVAVTPSFVSPTAGSAILDTKNTIEFLNTLEIKGNVIMLDADGGYEYYITAYPVQRIRQEIKSENFDAFLTRYKINMIVVSPYLLTNHRYSDDEEWVNFLNNYSTFGFVRLDIPESDSWLLISSALLAH